jgi:phosphonate transport system substrate-binding protein
MIEDLTMKLISLLASLCFLILPMSVFSEASHKTTFSLGIFPYLPPQIIKQLHTPLVNKINNALSKKIKMTSTSSYARFIENLKNESYDIILVQPFDYIWAHDQYNYQPLAKYRTPLSALFMVPIDSPINTLADLNGKTVATPPKTSAVSQMALAKLASLSIQTAIIYEKNHLYCLKSVLFKKADTCVTAIRSLNTIKNDITEKFRLLYETQAMPNVLFAVHQRVPLKTREKIKEIILNWKSNETSRGKTKFITADDSDYDVIRRFRP